jgi:glucose-1-phosphate thymidylyltransferase
VKGLVLAGGAGTRLRPITHTSAKQLVPVANKPILFYGLEDMAAAGITEVGVIVGESGAEIRQAVGDGSRWGLRVTFIDQAEPLGLAHCVLIARDFLGDDEFVLYLGDNMLQQGLADLVERFEAERAAAGSEAPAARILLARVEDPRQFGVAEIAPNGDVAALVEKPANPPSDLALVGVYLFDATIHDAVRAIEPSGRNELEITDAIQWLLDHGHRVGHEILEGWWIDTGKKDSLLESNRRILETLDPLCHGHVDESSSIEGRVVIEKDARIVNGSRVRGPAIIGERSVVDGSFVGPFTSVAADCRIVDAELDHSVVLDHSEIVGVSGIADSLVGRYARVERSSQRPHALRLTLGDHSHVELE